MTLAVLVLAVYLTGVAIGLVATDDDWVERVAVAFLWPLGLLAFVTVITGLTIVAAILWPVPMLLLGGSIGMLAYLLA